MEIKVGQQWKHYKGVEYKILLTPKDSEGEDMKSMVVYQDVIDMDKIWVQSQKRFLENVKWEGNMMPRFTLVS